LTVYHGCKITETPQRDGRVMFVVDRWEMLFSRSCFKVSSDSPLSRTADMIWYDGLY